MMRGVRGATTADENTREAILAATRELLELMIAANGWIPMMWRRQSSLHDRSECRLSGAGGAGAGLARCGVDVHA